MNNKLSVVDSALKSPKLCFVFVTCWVINRTFRKIDF